MTSIQLLYPIIVMFIMIIFLHEKFHWHMGAAVLLAVLGVASTPLGGGKSDERSGSLLLGDRAVPRRWIVERAVLCRHQGIAGSAG